MQSNQLENNFLYNDINQLYKLKKPSNNSKEGLEAVARQFESLYLNMMMQSMRSAERIWSEDNPFSSQEVQFYEDMLDNQMSVNLSQSKGLGLADMIIKQFKYYVGESIAPEASSPFDQPKHAEQAQTAIQPIVSLEPSAPLFQQVPVSNTTEDIPRETDSVKQATEDLGIELENWKDLSKPANSPEAFIDALLPIAKQVAAKTGMSPKVLVAQAALETGWGQFPILTSEGKNSHNLFGIKTGSAWEGESTAVRTKEFSERDQAFVQSKEAFRVYSDYQKAFSDYIDLISTNPRYVKAWQARDKGSVYISELQSAGYATDPQYAKKVMSIMNSPRFSRLANTYASSE